MEPEVTLTSIMLNRKGVCALTGLCYTTIYTLEKKGDFPARRKLSPGRVGWIKEEVEGWINSRVAIDC